MTGKLRLAGDFDLVDPTPTRKKNVGEVQSFPPRSGECGYADNSIFQR